MLKETKIGNLIIVSQTTYYLYKTQEDRDNDKFYLCTSDKKVVDATKKRVKRFLKKNPL